MFIVEPKMEPEYYKRLKELYTKCKYILSSSEFFDYIIEVMSDKKIDYVDSNMSHFLQCAYIGIAHYVSENKITNSSSYSYNEECDLEVTTYKVKYNDVVFSFVEIDGDDIFVHRCYIDEKPSELTPIDFNDLCKYYVEFDPSRPHDKQRNKGQNR